MVGGSYGKRTSQKFLLNNHGFSDDCLNYFGMGTTLEVAKEQTREIGVHTLIAADELIRESEARHEAPFLHPENRGK